MTSIPYEVEPEAVGRSTERARKFDGGNDASAFPYEGMRYTIECRLRIKKYTRAEAYDRCAEIHGTAFDGMFMAGAYFVFWSRP